MAAVPGTLREEIFSMVLEVVSAIMLPADAPGIVVHKKQLSGGKTKTVNTE